MNHDAEAPPAEDAGIFGLPHTPEEAGIVLVPVPWELTTSYLAGTADAPEAIRQASHQLDLYDPLLGEPWKAGIALAQEIEEITDLGEIDPDDTEQVNAAGARLNDIVRTEVRRWRQAGKIVGVVGGDHSVSFGALQAVAEEHDSFGVLQIDAHGDLREAYEGFTWSHASIMRNVHDQIPQASRIVQVGVRDLARSEAELIESSARLRTFLGVELRTAKHAGTTWRDICVRIADELPDPVYISIDVDGLDPAFCPNTGTPVPGGLSFDELNTLLRVVAEDTKHTVIGFDLTEVGSQEYDANVGARILYQLCGWALWKP